ncbi:hypothetical protein B7C51_18355 [Paenibacillus larvae subsp. pulvifaciens]|uniref:Uncharacterized protein n=1 Tax=Paenibacillus larvae subsp. pulvifaciens TaxID=1477 RepID=A0A1V0UVX3_9BACL|nr:hypothetical protein B7C51_18355 [Paenibacillus larvae subsp. pulvifaciens]
MPENQSDQRDNWGTWQLNAQKKQKERLKPVMCQKRSFRFLCDIQILKKWIHELALFISPKKSWGKSKSH